MCDFEDLLQEHFGALQRYVHFKINDSFDAEDIIQEVCLAATVSFEFLTSKDRFKAWLIGIASNKCNDYYRKKAGRLMVSLDTLSESILCSGRFGPTLTSPSEIVMQTLNCMESKEREILTLYYLKNQSQAEIAKKLSIPPGTVKSRLHYAREKFKKSYPYPPKTKGESNMTTLPINIPPYTITPQDKEPFSVRWEELQGWQLVPRLGEELSWGLYDGFSGRRTEYTVLKVLGRAEIHGIEGVEISAIQYGAEDYYRTGSVDRMERRFVAQLTDTHCRYLAESHVENGVRKLYTFLDGESFTDNWGYGENNCGNEICLSPKGYLTRKGNIIEGSLKKECVDIVGRYTVTIGEKTYDTVCVMDIQCFNDGVASEQFLDRNGRTVLWRRFNKKDWAQHRFQKPWTELLPDNERLLIRGETYVHWYDCISDYIL